MANKYRILPGLQPPSKSRDIVQSGMENKFRGMQPPQIGPKQRLEEPQKEMEGFRGDLAGQVLPLTTAAVAEHVTFERGQLTKDVGWSQLGTPIGLIIGLIEHKWQFGSELYARVLRIFNEGGETRSQYWDGYEWVESATASEPMQGVYLSEVSIQGCLMLADGRRIMKWCEQIDTAEIGHDFASNLHITSVDETSESETGSETGADVCSDDVVITPAGAVSNDYTINYRLTWFDIPTAQEAVIEIEFYHNGILFTRALHKRVPGVNLDVEITGSVVIVQDKASEIRRVIEDGDTLSICVGPNTSMPTEESIRLDLADASVQVPPTNLGDDPLKIWQYVEGPVWNSGYEQATAYEYHFTTKIPAGETLVVVALVVYTDPEGAILTLFEETFTYINSSSVEEVTARTETIAVANAPVTFTASLFVDASSSAGVFDMPFDLGPISGSSYVLVLGPYVMDYDVHPFNHEVDGDPEYGITYDVVTGGTITTFEPLSDNAPGARYIFSFADRLLALQDYGDRQSLAWCSDGDTSDWLPPAEGGTGDAGQSFLLDAQIDPIDDLMAGAHIGGGNFALYRKRSIWRGFETGNVELAIGVVPWIAGIGTEFRFSVQIVPGGNIFLGSDSMVYILTEGGQLTPVGGPILHEIRRHLTAENIRVDYDLVDSLFDSWLQHYWLAIPEDGAEFVTVLWIFDLGLFQREGKVEWRKRPMPNGVRRLAAVTMLPEPTETES